MKIVVSKGQCEKEKKKIYRCREESLRERAKIRHLAFLDSIKMLRCRREGNGNWRWMSIFPNVQSRDATFSFERKKIAKEIFTNLFFFHFHWRRFESVSKAAHHETATCDREIGRIAWVRMCLEVSGPHPKINSATKESRKSLFGMQIAVLMIIFDNSNESKVWRWLISVLGLIESAIRLAVYRFKSPVYW